MLLLLLFNNKEFEPLFLTRLGIHRSASFRPIINFPSLKKLLACFLFSKRLWFGKFHIKTFHFLSPSQSDNFFHFVSIYFTSA